MDQRNNASNEVVEVKTVVASKSTDCEYLFHLDAEISFHEGEFSYANGPATTPLVESTVLPITRRIHISDHFASFHYHFLMLLIQQKSGRGITKFLCSDSQRLQLTKL
uniref:Uncharacterized protein n=1 Tax=Arundo donax TaxID=35708 RepID=A0A0A9DPY9_ARUDO